MDAKPAKPAMPHNIRSMSVHRGLAVFYGLVTLAFLFVAFDSGRGMALAAPVFILGALAVAHGAIAYGAKRSAPWARIGSIVAACLLLLGFPIGTLIGIYLLTSLKWPKPGEPEATSVAA